MRVPVYARGADPRVARRILKKSYAYAAEQVENLLADWVNPNDHALGIVAREFLPSGKVTPAAVAGEDLARKIGELSKKLKSGLPPLEPDGCKFIPPAMEANPTFTRAKLESVLIASMSWDWTLEPATA